MTQPGSPAQLHYFPCAKCGARLEYAPGTASLRCPYCGYQQPVIGAAGTADASGTAGAPAPGSSSRVYDTTIDEHDFVSWQTSPIKPTGMIAAHTLSCPRCGASVESDDLSTICSFCGTPIVTDVDPAEQIVPEGVVPFGIDRGGAQDAIRQWVRTRPFAPGKLKRVGAAETLKGTYLPHWTFDANTDTSYQGLRGEHYWEQVPTTVMVDGHPETRMETVMKTRWWPASGRVSQSFDDVLIVATTKLSTDQIAALAPWNLGGASAYRPEYLSGYQTLRYDVQPDTGLEAAKQEMRSAIMDTCRGDIGGDEQQVHSMDTRYADLMFKLMLLPVWIATYLYGGKSYQVFVNAYTGQVIGQRPYSVPKIVAAVLAAAVVLAVLAYLFTQNSSSGGGGY